MALAYFAGAGKIPLQGAAFLLERLRLDWRSRGWWSDLMYSNWAGTEQVCLLHSVGLL